MSNSLEVKGFNGTVRFDGEMITISRKGLLARSSVGKGEKHIPLGQLTAVQFKPAGPLVNGFIQFTVGGGNEKQSRFGDQTFDAVKDENSVIFHFRQRKQFEDLKDAVQTALAGRERSTKHEPAPESAQASDIPTQIKQLAELRDSGHLTGDEFQAKKAELLQRM